MNFYTLIYIYFIINNKIIFTNSNLNKKNNIINLNLLNYFFFKKSYKYTYRSFFNYQLFNTIYLNSVYKVNLKEKHINTVNILPKKVIKHIIYKTKYKNYKNLGIKYFNVILYMFLINIWLKNSKLICNYIKTKLDNVFFKKHRKYFLFFFKLIKNYIIPNFKTLNIKGIKLQFKGKLARGGNSRKKTMRLQNGFYSLSNKCLALNQHKWNVWTKTGAVGCLFQLFYNKYDYLFKYLFNNIFYKFIYFILYYKFNF